MNKTNEIKQYEQKAKIIDNLITKGIIQNCELEELFHIDINEMINISLNKDDSIKKKHMMYIYFNPYILYFSNNISNKVHDELIDFVKYRYSLELSELNDKLNCCEINKDKYNKELIKIQMAYFYSSPIGTNIGRIIGKEEKVKTMKY